MKTEIIRTDDGSYTLKNEYFGETYHSINGAIAESIHIFVNLGLKNFSNSEINILEIGYGTGLNAILTFFENRQLGNKIFYHGIEKFPIKQEDFNSYIEATTQISTRIDKQTIQKFCDTWNTPINICDNFTLLKQQIDFNEFVPTSNYDIVYFDAFSPDTQPEMWSKDNMQKIINNISPNGYFVTYCCKGIVKQTLRDLGLIVKRFPGPKGKRHVIQARKSY